MNTAATHGQKLGIKRGDGGLAVAVVQRLLDRIGFRVEGEHGDFGPATDRAVRAFQEATGIPARGVVDRRTWEEMLNAAPAAGDATLLRANPYNPLQRHLTGCPRTGQEPAWAPSPDGGPR
jgi:peptidoglycan hydrolase-like protein with peptidoglycan-binding domain